MKYRVIVGVVAAISTWAFAVAQFMSPGLLRHCFDGKGTSQDVSTVLITHSLRGNIEPCGCGGNKKGGAAARIAQVRELRSGSTSELPVLEGGDWLTGGSGPWDAVTVDTLMRLFAQESTAAICLGENEIEQIQLLYGRAIRLTCANLSRSVPIQVSEFSIVSPLLVSSVVDPKLLVNGADVLDPPEVGIDKVIDESLRRRVACVIFLHASSSNRGRLLQRIAMRNAPVIVCDAHQTDGEAIGASTCGGGITIRSEPNGKQIVRLHLNSRNAKYPYRLESLV